MDFTFGIITGGNDGMINTIIDSIEKENIPKYEVIVVGPCAVERENTILIPFDENIKRAWITKKKNEITKAATYDNVVYLHDYIKLEDGWYEGQLKAGNDFHIRMDKIIDTNGDRYRDWCIWPHNNNAMDSFIGRDCLIPYDLTTLSKYMYISGSYWVAKKGVMLGFPLNESLAWGEGEDVLWSKQVRLKYSFDMNVNSTVKLMKTGKDKVFNEPDTDKIEGLNKFVS